MTRRITPILEGYSSDGPVFGSREVPQGESPAQGAHTPGPWEWTGIYVEADGVALAFPLENNKAADGRLMAAAPEMAAALRALVAWDDKAAKPYDWDAFYGLVNDARAALRKAGAL